MFLAEWSERDRDVAIALTEYEMGLHSCGFPTEETFNTDNDGQYKAHISRCYACAEAERVGQKFAKEASKNDQSDTAGIIVRVERRK